MAVSLPHPRAALPCRSACGRRRRLRSAFTLVEILLAIALSTLVLLAAAVFVFSAFNLLTQTENDPGLEHHKLGVVGYLEFAFSQAPAPPSNTTAGGNTTGPGFAGGTGGLGGNSTSGGNSSSTTGPALSFGNSLTGSISAGNQTNRVGWGFPPGVISIDNPYLTFRVDDDDPLLVWDGGPRPPATAWLYFKEGEGLSLIWQTDQQKLIDPNALQRTMLSPLVTKLEFVYYDATSTQWTSSDTPQKDPTTGAQLLPNFIRLTFRINNKDETMTVNLPSSQTNMPIY